MVKINFTIFFVVFGFVNLYGQMRAVPDSIVFTGIVINQATSQALPDVTCRYGHHQGKTSDEEGGFFIRTVRGDTIRFTHVGFKPYVIVISDTLLEEEYMAGIFMSPDTLQLSEALVLRRFKGGQQQNWVNARNNMTGIQREAYAPVKAMDADMNQRMVIDEYARSVAMKGHVDVRAGIGTQSLEAYKLLRLQNRLKDKRQWLNYSEIDLLKKLYYLEKKENLDN